MRMSSSLAWAPARCAPKIGCPCRRHGTSGGSLWLQETKWRLTSAAPWKAPPETPFLVTELYMFPDKLAFILWVWSCSQKSLQLGTTAAYLQWPQQCFLPCSCHLSGLGPSDNPSCGITIRGQGAHSAQASVPLGVAPLLCGDAALCSGELGLVPYWFNTHRNLLGANITFIT